MNTRETVAYRIRQLCRQQGLTPNGISIIAGVPQATVKSILNGESKNPGIVTIKNSAMGLALLLVTSFLLSNLMRWSRKSSSAN